MGNGIYDVPGLFGGTDHIDEHGNCIGYSMPGLFDGSVDHFNDRGEYIGSSYQGLFGEMNHVGADGSDLGYSMPGLFGDQTDHFDSSGAYSGTSYPGLFGSGYEGSGPEYGLFGDTQNSDDGM